MRCVYACDVIIPWSYCVTLCKVLGSGTVCGMRDRMWDESRASSVESTSSTYTVFVVCPSEPRCACARCAAVSRPRRLPRVACAMLQAGLCEYIWYIYHFRYKWLNYYVRMSKRRFTFGPSTSVSHSVFRVGNRLQKWVVLSVAATQNRVSGMLHGGPTRRLQQARDGRRRRAGGIASELRKHPKHGLKS